MKTTKRRTFYFILLLALLAALAPGAAQAELLFTRQDNSYANTALGIVLGNGAPIHPLVSNMGGNQGQGIYPFINADGNFRVAITLYTLKGTDVINIHDPGPKEKWAESQTWNRPQEAGTSLRNTRALVSLGGYLYGTAYDVPTINRVITKGDRYTEDKTYTYTPLVAGNDAHGEGLVSYGNALYAIFTEGHDVWDISGGGYAPNQLVKLDGNLNVLAKKPMFGKNLDGFTPGAYIRQGNLLYVATLGGVQPFGNTYNPESCVEIVDLETMQISAPVTARKVKESDPTFSHMFGAVAAAWGKIYVQATQWTSVEEYKPGYSIRIYETTANRLAQGDLGRLLRDFKGEYGYRMGLVYDPERNYLWAGVGYSLWRYDGSNWKEFDANALGGNISAYAATRAPEGSANHPSPSSPDVSTPDQQPGPSEPAAVFSGIKPSLPSDAPHDVLAVEPIFFTGTNQSDGLEKAAKALSRSGLKADDLRVDPAGGIVKLSPKVAKEVAKKVLPASEAVGNIRLLPIFSARLEQRGGVAAAGFDLTITDPKGRKASEIKLLKVTGPNGGRLMKYAGRSAAFEDGCFTVLDASGAFVEQLKPYVSYVLVLFIEDGGEFDLDGELNGSVVDPAVLLSMGTPDAPAPGPDSVPSPGPETSRDASGGGGGGGCDAGFGFLLLLAVAPAVLYRKR